MPAPVNSTYVTKEFPIVHQLDSRSFQNSKDGYWENLIPNINKNQLTGDDELSLVRRDGTAVLTAGTGTGTTRGFHHWKDQQKLFICVGRDVNVYTTAGVFVTTFVNAVAAGTSDVGFCQYLTSTNTTSVIFTDGTTLSQVSTAMALTVCADADLPTPHLPIPVFFDGYLLLVKANTNDCYNSDLDLPLSWTPGNFISAEKNPDVLTGISTINDYFVLLGSESIEFFYDAGNPTGTPFARNDTFIKLNGFYSGLTKYGNSLVLISTPDSGTPDISILDNFTLKSVGNQAIRRRLASFGNSTAWVGNIIPSNGTNLYIFQQPGQKAYYIDLNTGLWGLYNWANTGGFPIVNSENAATAGISSFFVMSNSIAIYYINSTGLYTDAGVVFTATVVTDKERFDTHNQKFISSLSIWADRCDDVVSSNPINVSFTTDDYQTYSTPRSVELNHERVNLQQWGRFRYGAFKITHQVAAPFKLYKLQADMNMGTT